MMEVVILAIIMLIIHQTLYNYRENCRVAGVHDDDDR